MAFIRRIDPFNENEEDRPSYSERLAQFLVVNGGEDERKTAALISLIGPKLFRLLKSLTARDDQPINQIVCYSHYYYHLQH